jgi:hypothetical protein
MMWTVKSDQYIVLLKSLKVACDLSCRPNPAPSPSQPPSRATQRSRREAFHYTEINTKN